MSRSLSRRDFLKLAGSLSGGAAAPRFMHSLPSSRPAQAGRKNILIVVFDTLSATHLPLHGYPRSTAPNLTRLAERAVVYHNHFAAGPWTIPSTASLFTGVLPWSHRAFNIDEPIDAAFAEKNLFHAFNDYHRVAYSHNPLVYTFLDQYESALDSLIPIQELFLTFDILPATVFRRDDDAARLSWRRIIKKTLNGGYSYSLFLSALSQELKSERIADLEPDFPRGLPNIENDNYFVLGQAIDFLGSQLHEAPQPFLAYFHFWPPHHPYKTVREFYNSFLGDGLDPVQKPRHIFSSKPKESRYKMLAEMDRRYDEVIPYVDREFGRLLDRLEQTGVLEDTLVILTSDHGELFERGILGHGQPVLYQGVIRVPLMIFEPGRTSRLDIHTTTSTIDLLPTLLKVTDHPQAGWAQGQVLPPFAESQVDAQRSIISMNARHNEPWRALTTAAFMLARGPLKLHYTIGYEELRGREQIELYDLKTDPDELNDLYQTQPERATDLLDELKTSLAEANAPYA